MYLRNNMTHNGNKSNYSYCNDMNVSPRVSLRGKARPPSMCSSHGIVLHWRSDPGAFLSGTLSHPGFYSGPQATAHPAPGTFLTLLPQTFHPLSSFPTGFRLGVEHTLGLGVASPLFQALFPWWPRPNPARAQSLATTLFFPWAFPWPPLAFFPCFIFLQHFYHYLINHSFFLFVHLIYCLSSPPRLWPTWWLALIFFFF